MNMQKTNRGLKKKIGCIIVSNKYVKAINYEVESKRKRGVFSVHSLIVILL